VEWQHSQNQLLGQFGLAIGWNKKKTQTTFAAMLFSLFSLNVR
jgi:hypothetical protein